MSNVASLNLCKELYELSGWNGTEKCWATDGDSNYLSNYPNANLGHEEALVAYAYDLGYLLRKLPLTDDIGSYIELRKVSVNGSVRYVVFTRPNATPFNSGGETAEDAACKLTIELFKQNVLTKEQPHE